MLRLVLTTDDLVRVRLRETLGPLGETLLAIRALRSPADIALLGGWRRRIGARLPRDLAVAARHAYLLPLLGPVPTVELGLASLRRDPPTDVDRVAGELVAAFDRTLGPHWTEIRARLDAEYANRARLLAEGGIAGLLATLHPAVRWQPPVLELARPGVAEHHLGGRGLDVVPSLFCPAGPQVYRPAGAGPLLLIYPAPGHDREAGPVGELGNLLGQTRAAVLAATADGATTGELARRLRISPAGASQHATVLRRAGLILSTRRGNAVLHTVTPLGSALLGA
jgi:DNA-binding transcriptional ArsR family regulator